MLHVGRCFNTDQNGILRPTGGKLGLGGNTTGIRLYQLIPPEQLIIVYGLEVPI
jgi:hypothetical protein